MDRPSTQQGGTPSKKTALSNPSPLRRRNSARSFQRNRVTRKIIGADGDSDEDALPAQSLVDAKGQAMPRRRRRLRQTFGDILQRLLVRMVRSRYFRWFIDLLLASEVASVLLFAIPYTYVIKREIMKLMLKSPISQVTRRIGLYSGLYVLMFTSCAVEYMQVGKRREQAVAKLEAAVVAASETSTNIFTTKHSNSAPAVTDVVEGGVVTAEVLGNHKDNNATTTTTAATTVTAMTSKKPESSLHTDAVVHAISSIEESITRLYKVAGALVLLPFVQRSEEQASGMGLGLLTEVDQQMAEHTMLRFRPPPLATIKLFSRAYSSIFEPKVYGGDNIPDPKAPDAAPLMFVSNHTVMAFDFPLCLTWLYENKGIFFRAMADHAHFQIPVSSSILANIIGAVDGTRRNCDVLLKNNLPVFLYPGGARETFKRTTDRKYELFWENKYGFCKMAIKNGAEIVPVINFGTEDMVDVVKDLPMGWLPIPFLWGSDRTFPLLVPRKLEKIYFYFAPAIPTIQYNGDSENPEFLEELHQTTKKAIEEGLAYLKQQKQTDDATEAKEYKESRENREASTHGERGESKFKSAEAMGRAIQRAATEMPTFVDANM